MGICQSSDLSTPTTQNKAVPSSAASKPQTSNDSQTETKSLSINNSDGTKKFNDVYRLGETLGKGAFSVVREGTHKKSDSSFAIKIVMKSQLTPEDETALKDEINILQDLEYSHIIRLYAVYDESNYFYLITERMLGGELFDRIVSKCYYNEKEARDVCATLFVAMDYIHKKRVAHRDLKPENLLLMSEGSDSDIKIADFGFAKRTMNDTCLRTQCGTPGYVAPEILEGVPYGTQADMWSLGVIAFILLGGYPPFIEENQRDLFRKIRKGQYEFHEEYWGGVSDEAKDLITSLLSVNPETRFSAQDALNHSWIKSDDTYLEGKDLGVNLAQFKRFNAKRKFKSAVKAVIVVNKLSSLGDNFKDHL